MMNGREMNRGPRVVKALAERNDEPGEVISELYLLILTRPVQPSELELLTRYVAERSDRSAAYQDICWALLNSAEFISHH